MSVTRSSAESDPHVPHDDALARKTARAQLAWARFPDLRVSWAASVGAERQRGYRLRAKLVVQGAAVGLYEPGTHRLAEVPDDSALTPPLAATASALRRLLAAERWPLSGVDLRQVDAGVIVTFIVAPGTADAELRAWAERLRSAAPEVVGVARSLRAPDAPQLLGNDHLVLTGASEFRHQLVPDAPWHYATHGAFTQVHAEQTAKLHAQIQRVLEQRFDSLRSVRVLELYAGSGLLALRLAALGAQVTAVEAYEPAILRLRRAAREQGLTLDAVADDAAAFVQRAARSRPRFDVVLVNPPRRGVAPDVRSGAAALEPRVVVYVSCNPDTQARDAADWARLGLSPEELTVYDMIPRSQAIESLLVLARAEPSAPRVIYEDPELLVVEKPPHEPVSSQGARPASLHDRVRRAIGGACVPVHSLDDGASGLCVFARRPELAPQIAKALEAASKQYIALVRGITRSKGVVNRAPRGRDGEQPARTRYRRLRVVAGHSLLELRPEPDRPQQITAHLAAVGHPVLGDSRHGDRRSNQHFEMRHGLDRPFLHLASVKMEWGGRTLELRAAESGDLTAVLSSLETRHEAASNS